LENAGILEKRYHELLVNLDVGIVVHAPDTSILLVNPKASELLGLNEDQMKGKLAIDLQWKFFAEDNTPLPITQYPVSQIVSGKKPIKNFIVGVNRPVTRDIVWLVVNGCPVLDNEGEISEIIVSFIDITGRKKAEKVLSESEEKYRTIFENVQDVFYQTDLKGVVLEISPSIKHFSEFSSDEIIGKPVELLYFNPGDRVNLLNTIMTHGELRDYELRLKTKTGLLKYVSINARLINDHDGRPDHITGAIRDITARKEAEERLHNERLLLRTLIDNIPDAIYSKDLSCRKTLANLAEVRNIGVRTEDDILGKDDFAFYPAELAEKFFSDHQSVIQTGIPVINREEYIFDSKGRTQYLLTSKLPLRDKDGTVIGLVGIGRNITTRKLIEEALRASELKFRTVADYTFDWEYWQGVDQQIIYMSTSCQRITGYTADEFISNPALIHEIVHPDDIHSFKRHNDYIILNENVNEISEEEFRITSKEGSIVNISHVCRPIFDETNKYLGRRVSNRDITARKMMEEDLVKAKEHAEESDRLKSAFLANMSHEIRTPMNGILGFAGLLKEPNLSGEEQQEYISIIEKSGARMLNIINDIISISKVESGQMEVSISETNINAQIEYIYTFFKPEAEQKGIQLSFKNSLPKNEAILKTDREKVYAILTNLVKNAIKFTPSGSIEFGYEKKVNCFEFFVRDTGVGIQPGQKEFIFERFRQGNELLSRNYEGAGLGLSIAKAYVEMLGGTIRVESDPEGRYGEKGTAFYFTLPYSDDRKEKISIKNIDPVPSSELPVKDLRILIAEDDEGSATLLTMIMKMYCKEVFYARTGTEAVESFRNIPDIDLVIMDIKMPEMDGYEATRQIRQFNTDVVIIAQTAYALAGDREEAINAGCNDYISKPVHMDQLIGLVQKYFKNKR